jgi:hypothetical protein
MMTWQTVHADMAEVTWQFHWQIWESFDTHGIILANVLVPRGPVMGCHVAPLIGYGLFKIIWSPWDSNPGPPPMVKAFAKSTLPTSHTLFLLYYMCFNVFKFV